MTDHIDTMVILKHATERLESASILHKAGNYSDAISRAYYAIFDAARAALFSINISPKSHAGTLVKFNEHFVKTGLVPNEFSKIFSKIERSRLDADYNFMNNFSQKESADILTSAKDFVKQVETLLTSPPL